MAGQLVPALRAALERPVPLPATVSTVQAAGAAAAVALAGAVAAWLLVWRRPAPTYLLDFECYRPGGCCCRCWGCGMGAAGGGGLQWRAPAVGAGGPPPQRPAAAALWLLSSGCCRCRCCTPLAGPLPPSTPQRIGTR